MNRRRSLLLLALAVTLAAVLLAGDGLRSRLSPPARPATLVARSAVDDTAESGSSSLRHSPPEAARRLADVQGVLRPAEDGGVLGRIDIADSTFFGEPSPFVAPRAFASGDVPFDLLGGGEKTGELVVPRTTNLDSLLLANAIEEGCEDHSLHVPFAAARSIGEGWTIGAVRGSTDPWTPRTLPGPSRADTLQPDSTALRLALEASSDSTAFFRDEPMRVAAERVEHDGAEMIVAQAWRGKLQGRDVVEEQIFLVAERPVGTRDDAWTVGFRHVSADYGDQVVTYRYVGRMLAGQPRRPVLLLDGDYRDGGGGIFVARVAPGVWREVASWYVGC